MNRSFSFALVSAALALSSVACAVDSVEGEELTGSTESAVVGGPGDITSAPDVTRCGGSCKEGKDCDGFAKKCTDQGTNCGVEQVGHPAVGTWLQCVTTNPPKPSTAERSTIDDITAATGSTRAKGCCNQTESGGLTGCTKPYYPPSGGGATCVGSMVKAKCNSSYSSCSSSSW